MVALRRRFRKGLFLASPLVIPATRQLVIPATRQSGTLPNRVDVVERALLQEAVGRDDIDVARTLIEAGADMNGLPENRMPALVSARSAQMVDLLAKASADPNERPVGQSYPLDPFDVCSPEGGGSG